jgi:hypothetical protein
VLPNAVNGAMLKPVGRLFDPRLPCGGKGVLGVPAGDKLVADKGGHLIA